MEIFNDYEIKKISISEIQQRQGGETLLIVFECCLIKLLTALVESAPVQMINDRAKSWLDMTALLEDTAAAQHQTITSQMLFLPKRKFSSFSFDEVWISAGF